MPAHKAKPATFDRSQQRRRAMLAKVHIAKKDLRMADDDYRQILLDETGEASAGKCDADQLERVIERMKGLGFKPIPKKGGAKPAMHPMGRKARALWISLHQLGVVHNASEHALEAFAKKQLGCEKLVWAKQSDANKLIEALKNMAERAGWHQTTRNGGIGGNRKLQPMELQSHLCDVILAKLKSAGFIPDHWNISTAAERLFGIETGAEPWSIDDYQTLAGLLGKHLRENASNGGSADREEAA